MGDCMDWLSEPSSLWRNSYLFVMAPLPPPAETRLMIPAHFRYTLAMSRFAPSHPDLFAPPPPAPAAPERPPLEELAELLSMLRAADRLPWPDLSTAMAVEYRAMGLGRRAGPEGERLVSAIMDETERLFSAQERETARRSGSIELPRRPRRDGLRRLRRAPTPPRRLRFAACRDNSRVQRLARPNLKNLRIVQQIGRTAPV